MDKKTYLQTIYEALEAKEREIKEVKSDILNQYNSALVEHNSNLAEQESQQKEETNA